MDITSPRNENCSPPLACTPAVSKSYVLSDYLFRIDEGCTCEFIQCLPGKILLRHIIRYENGRNVQMAGDPAALCPGQGRYCPSLIHVFATGNIRALKHVAVQCEKPAVSIKYVMSR